MSGRMKVLLMIRIRISDLPALFYALRLSFDDIHKQRLKKIKLEKQKKINFSWLDLFPAVCFTVVPPEIPFNFHGITPFSLI